MRYQERRRLYSQNFLRDPELISKLIRDSSIGKSDIVLEIGPGKGIITSKLLDFAGKVIAVELDRKLFLYLDEKFSAANNLKLFQGNFLNFNLPTFPFKVFANIPFSISSEIIKKITDSANLTEAYLFVQKETAKKFIGKPYDFKNSMMAALLKPWYEISIFWIFNKSDFVPAPNVDVVMIRILKRKSPLLPYSFYKDFRSFILYSYNRQKMSKLDFDKIVAMFDYFENHSGKYQKAAVFTEAGKISKQQEKLEKIHRTRNDKNWKKFKRKL